MRVDGVDAFVFEGQCLDCTACLRAQSQLASISASINSKQFTHLPAHPACVCMQARIFPTGLPSSLWCRCCGTTSSTRWASRQNAIQ